MEEELDNYLNDNYGNERYFNSLYRYIHNGRVSQDTYSSDKTSAFYYTLFCAFLNSDDNYLGENNFADNHWTKLQKSYPDDKYEQNDIKKCFLHYYNAFKELFSCPSDFNKASVNAVKETVIDNIKDVKKLIVDQNTLTQEQFKEICKQNNAEADIQSEKDNPL